MVKAALALAAAALLSAPVAPPVAPPITRPAVPVADGNIVRLECAGPRGLTSGTAVMIGAGVYVTAAHVVDNTTCGIGPSLITVTYIDTESDFAMFTAPPVGRPRGVSCKGFKPGESYLARGFAGGGDGNAHLPWIASPFDHANGPTFTGDAFPGMSGGPLLDRKGRVVGVVLRRLPSIARPLSETPVCR